jgi:hypothetical protein
MGRSSLRHGTHHDPSLPRDDLQRIRKLAALPEKIRRTRWAVSITRLTVLKSLCQPHERANRFVAHLARKAFGRLKHAKETSAHPVAPTELSHQEMMTEALEGLAACQHAPTEKLRRTLSELHGRMVAEQNEYRNIPFGALRLITDGNLFLFEYALSCVLAHERVVGTWVYQTARQYTERYDSSQGTGLISASIPLRAGHHRLLDDGVRPDPGIAHAGTESGEDTHRPFATEGNHHEAKGRHERDVHFGRDSFSRSSTCTENCTAGVRPKPTSSSSFGSRRRRLTAWS